MGVLAGKLKMAENIDIENMFDDNIDYEDLLLFLLAEEDIDEEYFLLIAENENMFKQSNFPFQGYDKFNWDTADELFCKVEFRFKKEDIPRLKTVLTIPDEIRIKRCTSCSGLETLSGRFVDLEQTKEKYTIATGVSTPLNSRAFVSQME